jgi:hypothetical protein
MAGRQRTDRSATVQPSADDWIRDRPIVPAAYGISASTKGLLPWSHVDERMSEAMRYWVSSVDGEGRPHSMPVDGMWIDGRLYFGGSPTTKRHRNLGANPAACVHLEDAMNLVVLHGEARELRGRVSPELSKRIIEQSKEKYGFAPPVDDLGAGGVFEFEPRLVFAWKDFAKDATRVRRAAAKAAGKDNAGKKNASKKTAGKK